jgi:hypothetical protein
LTQGDNRKWNLEPAANIGALRSLTNKDPPMIANFKQHNMIEFVDNLPPRRSDSTPSRKPVFLGLRAAKITFLIFFFIPGLSTDKAQAQTLINTDKNYVVVTVPQNIETFNKNRKLKSYRPQLYADNNGVQVRITQTGKLPKELKKVQMRYRSAGGKSEVVSFRKNTMLSQIRADQLNLLQTLERDGFPHLANYQRSIPALNKGYNGGAMGRNQWYALTSTRPAHSGETLSFRIRQGFLKRYSFDTDTLPVARPLGFPVIDANPCEPFDRFYTRKQLKGYGLDKIKYQPYRIPNRKIVRQSFEVFFEKNEATLSGAELQPIIDFLRENQLSILDIRIEGYTSIEGDSLRNAQLHQNRARKLISVLQEYNNEPIFRDTVIVAEAWEMFRTAIRHSALRWLDTLTQLAIYEC